MVGTLPALNQKCCVYLCLYCNLTFFLLRSEISTLTMRSLLLLLLTASITDGLKTALLIPHHPLHGLVMLMSPLLATWTMGGLVMHTHLHLCLEENTQLCLEEPSISM